MKKILFLFALLASITASAAVTVTPLSVDYSTKEVTFRVSWTSSPTAPYNNRVWVWVDLCPITGTTPGTFAKAVISGAAATAGSIDAATLNGRGFYVTTNPSTVTAMLSNATGQFNWCAYGSDYPPNATMANGTYTLKGSPPFKITYNGSSNIETSDKSFTLGCMTSITDATGCPGIINYPFSAGALDNGSWGTMGEFLNVGGTPLSIVAAVASSGSGKIAYQWYKNNAPISGATASTYLPPKEDAATAGTFYYTRTACDDICYTAETPASGTWTNVVDGPIHPFKGCSIDVARYDITGSMYWQDGTNACADLGEGWRMPTVSEFRSCFDDFTSEYGIKSFGLAHYWTSTIGSGECYSELPCCTDHPKHVHVWYDYERWNTTWDIWGDYCMKFNIRCVKVQ